MNTAEYYKEFCKLFCVFNHQPFARERACGEGGDFVITTNLSLNHPYGYVLLCLLRIVFLALVRMEEALSATSLPFAYILLMSQDSIVLRI